MNYQLISSIVKGIWAIDQSAALGYAPLIRNIFGQSDIQFEFDKNAFRVSALDEQMSEYGDFNSAPSGSIAVIPVNGPLMKQDQYCGPVGMETLGNMVKEADASPHIDGIILKVDSPGGTVDGTETFANIIKETKKPVIAFADGLVASAALWIASASDEIWAANNKTQIGSVGVLLSFMDIQPAYEKLGVKFHQITADQSKDKTKRFDDLRAGNYDEYKKEVLNPLAEDFINAIKNNLNPTDDQLTGKVFFAQDVIGTLITGVASWDKTVERMQELIAQNKSKSNNKSKTQATMKQFEAINKALGVEEMASTDEGVFLNEEQLSTIDALLAQIDKNAADLKEAQENLTKAQADLETANQSIQAKDAEIAELRQTAGAETAKAVSEKETVSDTDSKDGNVVNEKKSFVENLAAVADEFDI